MTENDNRESAALRQLNHYLDLQDENLDNGDLHFLESFLLETHPRVLASDWTRVMAALSKLEDPTARQLLRAVTSRTSDPKEVARAIAEQIHARPAERRRIAFLVGAGASRSKPTEIPTVRELLPILWRKAAEIGHHPLLRIRDLCEKLGVRNIEDLLTAITLAQAAMGNRTTLQLVSRLIGGRQSESDDEESIELSERSRRRFRSADARLPDSYDPGVVDSLRDSIQTLFSVLVGMMVGKGSNDAHKAVADLSSQFHGATIVTTNYDTCLEEALGEGNYNYGLVESQGSSTNRSGLTTSTVRLAKLHGSLNWYSCLNCHRFFSAPLEQISRAFDAGLYPIISICASCQATAQQLIVPPIAQKFHDDPILLEARKSAEDAFRNAFAIVAIGYSFSEADEYILRMISRAIREDVDKIFIVADLDAQPFFQLTNFLQTHARAFDTKNRVHLLRGDAGTNAVYLRQALAGHIVGELKAASDSKRHKNPKSLQPGRRPTKPNRRRGTPISGNGRLPSPH